MFGISDEKKFLKNKIDFDKRVSEISEISDNLRIIFNLCNSGDINNYVDVIFDDLDKILQDYTFCISYLGRMNSYMMKHDGVFFSGCEVSFLDFEQIFFNDFIGIMTVFSDLKIFDKVNDKKKYYGLFLDIFKGFKDFTLDYININKSKTDDLSKFKEFYNGFADERESFYFVKLREQLNVEGVTFGLNSEVGINLHELLHVSDSSYTVYGHKGGNDIGEIDHFNCGRGGLLGGGLITEYYLSPIFYGTSLEKEPTLLFGSVNVNGVNKMQIIFCYGTLNPNDKRGNYGVGYNIITTLEKGMKIISFISKNKSKIYDIFKTLYDSELITPPIINGSFYFIPFNKLKVNRDFDIKKSKYGNFYVDDNELSGLKKKI